MGTSTSIIAFSNSSSITTTSSVEIAQVSPVHFTPSVVISSYSHPPQLIGGCPLPLPVRQCPYPVHNNPATVTSTSTTALEIHSSSPFAAKRNVVPPSNVKRFLNIRCKRGSCDIEKNSAKVILISPPKLEDIPIDDGGIKRRGLTGIGDGPVAEPAKVQFPPDSNKGKQGKSRAAHGAFMSLPEATANGMPGNVMIAPANRKESKATVTSPDTRASQFNTPNTNAVANLALQQAAPHQALHIESNQGLASHFHDTSNQPHPNPQYANRKPAKRQKQNQYLESVPPSPGSKEHAGRVSTQKKQPREEAQSESGQVQAQAQGQGKGQPKVRVVYIPKKKIQLFGRPHGNVGRDVDGDW